MDFLGYTRTESGNVLFSLGLATAVGSSVGGWLSDRVFRSRKWVVIGGNVVTVVCFLPLVGLAVPSTHFGWIVLFSVLGFFSSFRVLLYAHVKESVPPHLVGTAVTAVNFFIMVGPALLQQAIGAVLGAWPGAYRAAFLVPLLALTAGSVIYLWSRDSRPERPS